MEHSRIVALVDELLAQCPATQHATAPPPTTTTPDTTSTSTTTTTTTTTTATTTPLQYWVGIAGPPGSGKSTLVADLLAELNTRNISCVGIPMDGYHYSRAELDAMDDPVSAHRFRGAPFTFNSVQFVHDLNTAKETGSFSFPGFDHAAKDPVPNVHALEKHIQMVFVEGNYLLLKEEPWCQLNGVHNGHAIFDEMWYLKCELDVLKGRLAARHMKAWGWTMEEAMERIDDSDGKNMVTVQTDKDVEERASKVVVVG